MKNSGKEKVCLGAIVGVHGIRGEVKVKSFTENDCDIDNYGLLEDEQGTRSFDIKVVGRSKEILRVKIKGIDDRNAAEELIGCGLYAERSRLPQTDAEEFYHTDLIGLDVRGENNENVIGKVLAVYNFGAGDLLEVSLDTQKQSVMLPFTKQYVPEVNIKNGYIIIAEAFSDFAFQDGKKNES